MNYNEIPAFDSWRAWKTAEGKWEVKLESELGGIELHLSEDEDAKDDQIENGKFYLDVQHGPSNLMWIRERKGIEMASEVDADYVTLWSNGRQFERQHNHVHLDRKVENGRMIALTPV